ncbi:MAG: hypothetical protein GXP49_09485 [Deltaproteobacteria bacterium]|nr:hypothetical protein [Deltaproteobacteria bacterium]
MSLKIDLQARKITGAIKDLARNEGESQRSMGLFRRVRAELGTRVHQDYRKRRDRVAGFKAEVPVELKLQVQGFDVSLGGRLDGILRIPGGLLLEEVKSVAMGGADLAHMDASFFMEFAMQLKLYGLAVSSKGTGRVEARLVLCSLIDGSWHELPVRIDPDEIESEAKEKIQNLLEKAHWEETRALKLAAISESLAFPYKIPRPGQLELIDTMLSEMAKGRPMLALAPTGIGKTVSAVMAGLKLALKHNSPMLFLTAKNTQHELAARTFEDVCAANGKEVGSELKCIVLRAKERMCIPGGLACHPDLCPYLKDFQSRLNHSNAIEQALSSGPVVRPEVVFAIGESHRLCPFGLSLAIAREVNLVVCDYNYVFDPSVSLSQFFQEEGASPVVVIDEAHNLFDRARTYFSPVITRDEILELMAAIDKGAFASPKEHPAESPELPGLLYNVDGTKLFSMIRDLCVSVDMLMAESLAHAERLMVPKWEGFRSLDQDPGSWKGIAESAAELVVPYSLYNRIHKLIRPKDPILSFLSRVLAIYDLLETGGDELVYFVTEHGWEGNPAFGVLCVNPALMLKEMHKRALATAAMSATLMPLEYYSDVLGFSDLDPVLASFESPFPRENLLVKAVTHISTTYRQRPGSYDPIARSIETVLTARPGKYAVFFPSYEFLSEVDRRLKVVRSKVMVQSKGMSQEQRARFLEEFRNTSGPRVLLAVMGGAFAEGIDLPGSELIGAIVVGIGLPQVSFEREMMREYFQNHYEKGFAYAMLYPGLQRVVQSAGRVIRTFEDRGVVILVGKRFRQRNVIASLPGHWYRFSPEELFEGDLESNLADFWSRK